MIAEYGYEPTDLEDELFLSEIPIKLLQEAIQSQFNDPLEYRKKDYVQSFITKYEFSQENMLEDDLLMLEVARDEFLAFIEKMFYDYLSVGFNEIDDMSDDDQHETIHLTYRFFLKNMKKNFVNVVLNYINEHKNEILENYEKKKDVTSLNFKTEIEDEGDVIVLSNLGNIVNDILEELKTHNDVDEFLKLCETDEVILELEFVKNAYDEMTLTGNFIGPYINMINEEFQTEIQSKVRNKILKKYPYRVRKEDIIEDDTEDNNNL